MNALGAAGVLAGVLVFIDLFAFGLVALLRFFRGVSS